MRRFVSNFRPAAAAAVGVLLTALGSMAATSAQRPLPSSPSKLVDPSRQPADDEVAPLAPRQPRTEQEQDRLHAMTLFAAARMADRARNHETAMLLYSRAFRYDPRNVEALSRAVLLARVLGRHTMAARLASELVLRGPVEPLDLLRGIIYLRNEQRLADALSAYEKGWAASGAAAASPVWVELHKQAGEIYLKQQQFEKSAEAFARVLEALKNPGAHGLDGETLKLIQGDADLLMAAMAEAFIKAQRFELASEAIERAIKASGDDGLALYGRARLAAVQKRYAEARELLEAYLDKKLSSQGDAPYQLLAEVFKAQDVEPQLKGKLQRALALDGENQPLAFALAEKYEADKQWLEAAALYRRLLTRKPSTAGYRGLVRVARQQGEVGPLLDAVGEAVGKTGGLSVLGDEAVQIKDQKELVAKLAAEGEARLKQKPESLPYGQRLAVALLASEARQFDVARKFFELAIKADAQQQGALLSTWGLSLIAAEKYAEAVDVLQRALTERAVEADNPLLNFYLAAALSMVGRNEAALVAARKAAVADAQPELASRAAWVLYRAKHYDESRKEYEELLKKLDPVHDKPGVREAVREARLTLSHIHSLQGNMPQAEEMLEQVLDEFPDDIGVRNDLGYLWADQGKHLNRAYKMIREAVTAEPDNAAYRDSLGWILYKLGRYDEAVKELERAAAGEKPDGVVLDHLGDALEKEGRREEAISTWKRALEAMQAEPDEKRVRSIREKLEKARMSKTE